MSKLIEFWLWWYTDGVGRRRRSPYRMSREMALVRFPDAEPVAGTMEVRACPKASNSSSRTAEAANING